MAYVYITEQRVTEPGTPDDIVANWEFGGATWMDALDAAYAWLKANHNGKHVYHVWC